MFNDLFCIAGYYSSATATASAVETSNLNSLVGSDLRTRKHGTLSPVTCGAPIHKSTVSDSSAVLGNKISFNCVPASSDLLAASSSASVTSLIGFLGTSRVIGSLTASAFLLLTSSAPCYR